jgi:hypothetical protein
LSWNRTIYTFYGELFVPELVFPTNIEHNVRGFEIKMGRNCALIDYTITGVLQGTENDSRGKYTLQGKGVAFYDLADEIIVEKEQTISWSRLAETIAKLDNGQVGWKSTVDDIETTNIKISLVTEQDSSNIKRDYTNLQNVTGQSLEEKPLGIVLSTVVGSAVVVIATSGFFLYKRKSKPKQT